jgi:hypothetical protein
VFELHHYAIFVLVKGPYAIAEHGFHPGVYSLVDVLRQIAAKDAEKAIAQCSPKSIRAETSNALARVIDDPHLARLVASVFEAREQVHPLCDIETHAPEIHDVPAGAKDRRTFGHG